jgi:hypothetical protein
MLYICGLGVLILNLAKKNSKVIYLISILFLWILFGWSSGNADSATYLSRFENYNSLSNETEKIFTKLMEFVHKIGGSYQMFLIIVSMVGLIVIAYITYKFSDNFSFILALYFIFPFVMDVTQIRNYTAFVVLIYGFRYLFCDEKLSGLKYCICVIIATGCHFSAIVFLIMLVPKYFDTKKTILFTIVCVIILFSILLLSDFIIKYASLFINPIKVQKVLEVAQNRYNMRTVYKTWIRIFIFFGTFFYMSYILRCKFKKINNDDLKNCRINLNQRKLIVELVSKMNIIILIIIPLIIISVDFYRLQQVVSIFNYIAYTQYFIPIKKRTTTKGNILVSAICIIIAFLNLYLLVLSNINFQTVFRPIFENNLLFK